MDMVLDKRIYYVNKAERAEVYNGDVEKRKVYSTRAKQDQELDYFKAGDRVFHIYGSKYTVIIPKPSDTMAQCAVCGITTDINKGYCHKCGYTLPSFFSKE